MRFGWPLLRRAPGRGFSAGSTSVLLLVSVTLLAGLLSAGPLFADAVANGALDRRLSAVAPDGDIATRPVVRFTYRGSAGPGILDQIAAVARRLPYVAGGRALRSGQAWQLDASHPDPFITAGSRRQTAILLTVDGGIEQLAGRAGGSAPSAPGGVWISRDTAKDLHVQVGSTVRLSLVYDFQKGRGKNDSAPVAGIYDAVDNGRQPAGTFWTALATDLPADPQSPGQTAHLVIADAATFGRIARTVGETELWTYDLQVTEAGRTPEHLAQLSRAIQRAQYDASDPGSALARLAGSPNALHVASGVPQIVYLAGQDATSARQQGRGLAYAGGLLGLAAVLTMLRALSGRRRREVTHLVGTGAPLWAVVSAAGLELAGPALLGSAVGGAFTCAVFARTGPKPGLTGPGVRGAVVACVLAALAVIAVALTIAVAESLAAARTLAGREPLRLTGSALPALCGATALAVLGVLTRPTGRSFADPLSGVLPILLLACGCTLLARIGRSLPLVWSRVGRRRRPHQGQLQGSHSHGRQPRIDRTVRRGLRRSGIALTDLAVVVAVGVGVLVYGLASADAVHTVVRDKASVDAGAVSVAQVPASWQLRGGEGPEPELGPGSAAVWRTSGVLAPGQQAYEVIAAVPGQLSGAADFGVGQQLRRAQAALAAIPAPPAPPPPNPGADEPLGPPPIFPVVIVGTADRRVGSLASVAFASHELGVRIVAEVPAFPGANAATPTMIIDSRWLFPWLGTHDPSTDRHDDGDVADRTTFTSWIWTTSTPAALRTRMAVLGVDVLDTRGLIASEQNPILVSARWAASYQALLGVLAAALAGVAVGIGVDRRVARAGLTDLMLRRFGVTSTQLARVRAGELAGLGGSAVLTLVIPLAALLLLLPRLVEPAPLLRPVITAQLPWTATVAGLLTVAATVLAGSVVAVRRSAALQPSEVLRDDG